MVEQLRPQALRREISVKADLVQIAFRKLREEYLVRFMPSAQCCRLDTWLGVPSRRMCCLHADAGVCLEAAVHRRSGPTSGRGGSRVAGCCLAAVQQQQQPHCRGAWSTPHDCYLGSVTSRPRSSS